MEEEETQAVNRSSLRLEWLTEGRKDGRKERGFDRDQTEPVVFGLGGREAAAATLSRSIWAKWPRQTLWFGVQKDKRRLDLEIDLFW